MDRQTDKMDGQTDRHEMDRQTDKMNGQTDEMDRQTDR